MTLNYAGRSHNEVVAARRTQKQRHRNRPARATRLPSIYSYGTVPTSIQLASILFMRCVQLGQLRLWISR
jgi:hypothetical protein